MVRKAARGVARTAVATAGTSIHIRTKLSGGGGARGEHAKSRRQRMRGSLLK